jgi:hypothetical protein
MLERWAIRAVSSENGDGFRRVSPSEEASRWADGRIL